MNTKTLFSSAKDDWQTPPGIFEPLDAEFLFSFDVAASASNRKIDPYYDVSADALCQEWCGVCWCNPPYSQLSKFIAKAATERRRGVTTVLLIPARTDTRAWHEHIWSSETHQPREGIEVRFLKGRIKFVGAQHGAPFPSAIIVMRGAR